LGGNRYQTKGGGVAKRDIVKISAWYNINVNKYSKYRHFIFVIPAIGAMGLLPSIEYIEPVTSNDIYTGEVIVSKEYYKPNNELIKIIIPTTLFSATSSTMST
jgi:hypothetical protein